MLSVGGARGTESAGDMTPSSTFSGTPLNARAGTPPIRPDISISGRASRQSDAASELLSLGTTAVQTQSGTDHVIERYVACTTQSHILNVMHRVMTPRFVPELVDIEQDLFELPKKVCVDIFACIVY